MQLISSRVEIIQVGKQRIDIPLFRMPDVQQLALAVKISINKRVLIHVARLHSPADFIFILRLKMNGPVCRDAYNTSLTMSSIIGAEPPTTC